MQGNHHRRAVVQMSWVAIGLLAVIFVWAAAGPPAPLARFGGMNLFVDASVQGGQNNGTSWGDAFLTLQDALAEARINPAVDSIWVADGVYRPDVGAGQILLEPLSTFEMVSGVSVYGGFAGGELDVSDSNPKANRTVLSGDLDQDDGDGPPINDNAYHVVSVPPSVQWALVDGFVIRGGRTGGTTIHFNGGGLFVDNGAVTVARCVFERNVALGVGGAIFNDSGVVNVIDSEIWDTSSGLAARAGTLGGGTIHTRSGGRTSVVNTTIARNTSKRFGGGLFCGVGVTTVANSTIAFNESEFGVGGIYVADDSAAVLSVENSILWGNFDEVIVGESSQILVNPESVVEVNYSSVEGWRGGIPGVGTDSRAPKFAVAPNPELDFIGGLNNLSSIDLRIQAGSPTIDAANNDADTDVSTVGVQPLPATDLAGLPRFVDDPATPDTGTSVSGPPIVDRGAFEFQPGDCNYNGLMDSAEVAAGTSPDCNSNGIPDECDRFDGGVRDCNTNGIPDDCDIAAGSAVDANGDGAIDDFRFFVNGSIVGGALDGSSWADAIPNLQSAIFRASSAGGPCAEVWVAQGTYFPGTNGLSDPKDATFRIKSGVRIYGGFAGNETDLVQRDIAANPAILSCDFDQDDVGSNGRGENCDQVISVSFFEEGARVDGFTITGGDGNSGSGMNVSATEITVANCDFIDNSASSRGGGVELRNALASFDSCRFIGNDAGDGGAIRLFESVVRFTDCQIVNNRSQTGTAGVAIDESITFWRNCLFASNKNQSASTGSAVNVLDGIRFYDSSPTIMDNCTVAGNQGGAAAIINEGGDLRITNSIVFGNDGFDLIQTNGAAAPQTSIKHSCVGLRFGFADNSPIGDAPLFVQPPSDGDLGDLRLRPDSPCIDIGTNGPVDPDAFDLDSNPRIVGCGVDAGAYESQREPRLGDFDGDCAIDLNDYFIFEICHSLSGPDMTPPFEECVEWFDADGDADIDLLDFRSFAELFGL